MADQGSQNRSAADEAIRAALESVERLEREAQASPGEDDDLDPDAIEVLKPSDLPPSADPSDESDPPASDEEVLLDESDPRPSGGAPKKASMQDALLQSMIAAKNEAVQVLEQTQKEASSLKERLMRVSAEFENYKKRVGREKEDAIKFANERILKELLPVLDNFERAIQGAANAQAGSADGHAALATVVEGIEMVFKQLKDSLGRFGVEGFSAQGQRFDPGLHEAVASREDPSVPNQTVLEEYQRGYMLHGRLVRPAMVIVSSGGPPAPKAEAQGDGDQVPEGQGPDGAGSESDEA